MLSNKYTVSTTVELMVAAGTRSRNSWGIQTIAFQTIDFLPEYDVDSTTQNAHKRWQKLPSSQFHKNTHTHTYIGISKKKPEHTHTLTEECLVQKTNTQHAVQNVISHYSFILQVK